MQCFLASQVKILEKSTVNSQIITSEMNIDRMDKYILAIDYVKYLNNYFQRLYIYVYICISNINAYISLQILHKLTYKVHVKTQISQKYSQTSLQLNWCLGLRKVSHGLFVFGNSSEVCSPTTHLTNQ